MNENNRVTALRQAIESHRTQTEFVEALSAHLRLDTPLKRAHVWNWLHRDNGAPAWACPSIEAVSGVVCEKLCPEVRWDVLRGAVCHSIDGEITQIRTESPAANNASFASVATVSN